MIEAGEPLRNARPLSEIADALRESLLAEGARKERERLIEEIATMIEALAAEAVRASQPGAHALPFDPYIDLSDLARRVREMK